MSIVDLIKNQLSGEVLDKLSAAIGESPEKTRAASNAAVPSILSMLTNSALSGKGLEGLLSALRDFDGADPVATLKTPGTPAPPPAETYLDRSWGPTFQACSTSCRSLRASVCPR